MSTPAGEMSHQVSSGSLLYSLLREGDDDWFAGVHVYAFARASLANPDELSILAVQVGAILTLFREGLAEYSPYADVEFPDPHSTGFAAWLYDAARRGNSFEDFYYIPWIALTAKGKSLWSEVEKL